MHDVAILGGGPAGITAAIYSARYRMKTILISPEIGGWAKKAYRIENLPSYVSVAGKELGKRFEEHLAANDIECRKERVSSISWSGQEFLIRTNAAEHKARYMIYALGTKKRMLNVPGEEQFLGKGVCLCATCDAPFFKDKDVAVIGGNDSGATSALLIAEYAKKVYVIEMLPKLPSEPIWQEKLSQNSKIEVRCAESVSEIVGDKKVKQIKLKSGSMLDVDGVFIEIGSDPDTAFARDIGAGADRWGHIEVDSSQMSSIDRLYAAGDATNGSNYLRQIVAAQAEGAVAAQAIYKRILKGE